MRIYHGFKKSLFKFGTWVSGAFVDVMFGTNANESTNNMLNSHPDVRNMTRRECP